MRWCDGEVKLVSMWKGAMTSAQCRTTPAPAVLAHHHLGSTASSGPPDIASRHRVAAYSKILGDRRFASDGQTTADWVKTVLAGGQSFLARTSHS